MHAAIAEVGILYATAQVHEGWDDVGSKGLIEWSDETGDSRWPRLRNRGLRRARLLGAELVGPELGIPRLLPGHLRRLAGQRQRRLGGSSRRAHRTARPANRCRAASASPRRAPAATCSATCVRTSSASATTGTLRTDGTYGTSAEDVGRDFRAHRDPAGGPPSPADLRAWRADGRGLGDSESGRPQEHAARRRRVSALARLEDRLLDDAARTCCRTPCRAGDRKACSMRPRTSCSTVWTTPWSRWRA